MTKTNRFLFSLLLLSTILCLEGFYKPLSGQVTDDFSDGNFTQNPAWQGDTSLFQISTSSAVPAAMKPALQLDGNDPDTAILYLQNNLMDEVEWTFWIKLSFNTSANNYARVYLVSDQPDLAGPLNGYYLQVGGANDSIGLFKQTGGDSELILLGANAFTGNSTNAMRIRVTRDGSGQWELMADPEGGTAFQPEGSVFDDAYLNTAWFGIFCQYTASNATKFYFDDFYVGPPVNDTIPPEIVSVEALSEQFLDIYFSEAVTAASAGNILNYSISNGLGQPATAIPDDTDPTLVHLGFGNTFENGITYWLYVSGVEDPSGNILQPDSVSFVYLSGPTPGPGTVFIHELMADPDPEPAGLPAADYLELYNATDVPIDLSGCSLKPRESADPAFFGQAVIHPDSFLIVTHNSDTALFSTFGAVAGLPGFSLNNEGTAVLRNANGVLLHAVSYTKDWYHHAEKQEGGWALEMIDPEKPCAGIDNWLAAVEVNGGTPGSQNSVNGTIYSVPAIIESQITSPDIVALQFNHDMDSLSIVNPQAYRVLDAGIAPVEVQCAEIHFNRVDLIFDFTFEENQLYTLQIIDSLHNCAGAWIEPGQEISIVRPSFADPWDIVINEILPDPDPPVGLPEYEFIEIFNTTNKYLLMSGWILQVGTVQKPVPDAVIEPGEYLIFADDDVAWLYEMFGRTLGFSSLGLTNSGAEVSLLDENGRFMSSISYSNSWYIDETKSEGGWSLEQIDPFNPCAGAENWSEAMAPEGGTPGAVNSVDADNPLLPRLMTMVSLSANRFQLTFNQVMDRSFILNPEAYFVDHTVGTPVVVTAGDSLGRTVILEFSGPLLKQTVYELRTELPLNNCRGLELPVGATILFGISETVQRNDLAINEVLFNPAGNGVDFVEVYNRSEKIADLDELFLGHVDTDEFGVQDTLYRNVTTEPYQLLPGDYLVLTTDPERVKDQYYTENPRGFFRMASFPVYNNASGTVVLAGAGRRLIDHFDYNESMHYPLLTTVEGVSLERIDYDRPASDKTNWHSASGEVGFATPAYQNSQFSGGIETEEEIKVEPETFSPDNDGFDDVLNIHYRFGQPGYNATIRVFDPQGRLTRMLIQNELLGTEGTFSWDGRTDDNRKAGIGIYIIYMEVFDLDGHVKKFKETAVLGGRIGN